MNLLSYSNECNAGYIGSYVLSSVAKVTEVGLLKRVKSLASRGKRTCNSGNIYVTVSLMDFKPALQAIAGGAVLSCALLVVEIIFKIR